MKYLLLFLCCILTGFNLKATAGKVLGAEISYTTLAPGLYVVNFKQVRDCGAPSPSNTYTLQISSPGCSSPGRNLVLTQVKAVQTIPDYCPGSTVSCAPANGPGIAVIYEYTATVTFTAAEQACSDWYFSVLVQDNTRAASANLAGTPPLYLEAFVKLGSNINNNSAVFQNTSGLYKKVIVNLNANYNLAGTDPDGDSLVYAMKPALQTSGTPVTYQAAFTAQNPIVSNPALMFSPQFGAMVFHPDVFVPNTLLSQGINRYVVAFQVDEYRKINGVATKIGSVQREMMFEIVEQDTSQKAPFFTNFTLNGQPFDTAQVVQVAAGQSFLVKFETNDVNAGDNLTYYQQPGILPFGNVTVTDNGIKPKIEMVLSPALNHVRPNLYFYPFRVQDDACPLSKSTNGVLKFEVVQISGSHTERYEKSRFTVYPNPFTESVTFRFNAQNKTESILIYNLLGQQIDAIAVSKSVSGEQQFTWQNAGKYAAGTYVAKLVSADKTIQTLKFVKLH